MPAILLEVPREELDRCLKILAAIKPTPAHPAPGVRVFVLADAQRRRHERIARTRKKKRHKAGRTKVGRPRKQADR